MKTFHPQFIEKNGKPGYELLPINEYQHISEILEGYEDLTDLRQAKKRVRRNNAPKKRCNTNVGLVGCQH